MPNVMSYSTVATLAAANTTILAAVLATQSGTRGVFVWDAANHQADVTSDPNRGLFIPPTGQNGSTGAWTRVFTGGIDPRWFGAVGDGISNDVLGISAAKVQCTRLGKFLDLTNAPVSWRLLSSLDLTGVPGVIASFARPLVADVSGSFPNGWAVTFGDPSQNSFGGRSGGLSLIGVMLVQASAR